MQIIFLGTSAMVPTKDRNHTAVFVRYNNEGIMFDCGEGTQRQLKIAEIKPSAVTKIVISHWDGDHVLGLPGLIQTLAMSEENKHLLIFGPKGSKQRFKYMFKAFEFYNKIDLEIKEYKEGKFYDSEDYYLTANKLEHKVPAYGFEMIEKDRLRINVDYIRSLGMPDGPLLGKLQQGHIVEFNGKKIDPKKATYNVEGKKIGIIADTRVCSSLAKIAKDKDVVICDSTFMRKDEDKAHEYFHMTGEQAAKIAQQANAKKLVLTHFSQRYRDVDELLQEAKDIFPETVAAHDFMKIKL
jgi:ribonuclease Z